MASLYEESGSMLHLCNKMVCFTEVGNLVMWYEGFVNEYIVMWRQKLNVRIHQYLRTLNTCHPFFMKHIVTSTSNELLYCGARKGQVCR